MSLLSLAFAALLAAGSSRLDPPNDLLGGPDVDATEATKPTLVKMSFEGRLEPLEEDPHAAAIRLLTLNEEQKAKLESILTERSGTFDRIVRANYGLLIESVGYAQMTPRDQLSFLKRVREAFKPYSDRGSCLEEMEAALTAEQRADVKRLVQEFSQAKLADMRQERGEDVSTPLLMVTWRLEEFGREVQRSIERQTKLSAEVFEQLLASLAVTAEQETRIRAVVEPFAVKEFQNLATDADRLKLFAEIRAILTPAQQINLFRYLARQQRGE